MSSNNPELPAALLHFINSFGYTDHENTWLDLRDGQVLWQILKTVAPSFFAGELPKPTNSENWIERWQNLKHVDRWVMAFIRDECGKLQEWSRSASIDLKAMAIDGSERDSLELVKAIVIAAVFSPEANQQVVSTLEKLGPRVSRPIASCIEQTIALDKNIAANATTSRLASPMNTPNTKREAELLDEQQLIEAFEQINKLEVEKGKLHDSLQETRRQKKELQSNLQDLSQRLDSSKSEVPQNKTVEQLLQTSEHDRDIIATLEREVVDLKDLNAAQVKQLDELVAAQGDKRQLRDEVELLRTERDELMQKENANDNLRKKIMALQEAAKSNEAVRQEYEAAQEELRSLRRTKDRYMELQKINMENLKTIQNGEEELLEELASRQRLEQEVQKLTDTLETMRNQREMDVGHLHDVIQELEAGQRPDSSEQRNLNDELDDLALDEDLKAENERLKVEITRLRVARELIETNKSESGSEVTTTEETESADDTNNMILQLIREGEDALQHASAEEGEHQDTGFGSNSDNSDTDNASIISSEPPNSSRHSDHAAANANAQNSLRREIRLMTSAWYDITQRIQSDAVIVQRRRDAPKSFLNRQRKLVFGDVIGIAAPGLDMPSSSPQRR